MALRVKVLAAKAEDLSSLSGYMVGEKRLIQIVL